jgi:hypothetical protein
MRDRPFPFPPAATTIRSMSSAPQREADLALRTAEGFVRVRVYWPPDDADGCPIAVFLTDGDAGFESAHALAVDAGCVVLAVETTALDVATVALEWAADHAQHLGANPKRLLAVGGELAAKAAEPLREAGVHVEELAAAG